MRIRFEHDRYVAQDGVRVAEFDPTREGTYLSLYVGEERRCVARFGKYRGRSYALGEAKRWIKAALAEYGTVGALYAALNTPDETGTPPAPGRLIPVPPPRATRRRARRASW